MEGLISKKSVIFLAILACLIAVLLVLAQENNSNPYPAINYAPNFWFDSEEQYYPANPLDFYYKNDKEVFGEIAVYRYNQLSIEEKLDKLTVFYHLEDEGTEWVYEYWLFYVFNDYQTGVKNKHYGDWEAVYVFVDKDSGRVNKAIGTAHQREIFDTEIYDPESDHIWTYVGNGSHANCIDEKDDGYCDSLKWRRLEKWDGNGEKVLYNNYNLREIDDNFIIQFDDATTLEKSSILGINIFNFLKIENKELYISWGGNPPPYAWEQSSYHNPEEIRPYSIKYALEKVNQSKNKIVGFFNSIFNKQFDKQHASITISTSDLEMTTLEEATPIIEEIIEEEIIKEKVEVEVMEKIEIVEIEIVEEEIKIVEIIEEEAKIIKEAIEENIVIQPALPNSMPFIGIGGPPSSLESEPEPEPEIIPDTTPPSSISNLLAEAGNNRGEISLSWTAPGDDESIDTSTEYIIRYSTSSEIISDNWASSTDIIGEPIPGLSGSSENLLISDLDISQTYYWAIKSKDEADNFSEISNCVSISPQAKADGLVISEIQVKGSSYLGNLANDEFIELYNPTDYDIDLSDWSIQYRGSGSVSLKKKNFVSGNSIPAKGYFLITNNDYDGHMIADMSHDSFQMSATGGNIFLVNNQIDLINVDDNSIVDKISYGSGDHLFPETLEFDLALGENQSLERKNIEDSTAESLAVGGDEHWQGNNFDSDNNSVDFVLQSNPNPQNSLTLTEPRSSFASLAETAWPMLQHDLQHTGLSPYSNNATGSPTSTSKLNWPVKLGSAGPTSPVIGLDGSLYLGAGGHLYKINLDASFSKLYSVETGGSVKTPIIDSNGNLYFADNFYLYALTSDGQLIWKYLAYGVSEPVIGSDGKIYIADSSYLYVLTPNGEKIWQSEQLSNSRWVRSPVIDSDGNIYTVGQTGILANIYKLNPLNGNTLWKTGTGLYSTALTMDSEGTIFVGGSHGLHAINSSDGIQKWHASIGNISYSIPAINQDMIYVGINGYLVYARDRISGIPEWGFATGDGVMAPPIVDNNGVIYVGSRDKKFYALNSDGSLKWQAELSDEIHNGAVIGPDGTIYVVTIDGNVYAFGK